MKKPGVGVYTYTASATGCVAGTPSLKQHAVSGAGPYTLGYDCNGNMTLRADSTGTFTQQWDRENRVITVTGSATGYFVFDGDHLRYAPRAGGNRVKATLGAATTVYIGNYYEQSGSVTTTYYYAGGARMALRQGTTVRYLLGDHLGSTSITANSSGGLYAEKRYKPWGEQRYTNGTTPTRRQYTGQINDSEMGLYFYGARMYSSVLGRFISADTVVPSPSDPQQLNRYAYGLNNPVKYQDPTGHWACEEECEGPQTRPYSISRAERLKQLEFSNLPGYHHRLWTEFTPAQQSGLSQLSPGTVHGNPVYWNESLWNGEKYGGRNVSVAGTSMDPAVWIAEFIVFRKIGRWLPEILSSGAAETVDAGTAPNINPGYPGPGRTLNCINCAVATDSTFAGYPASALPSATAKSISVLENIYGRQFAPVAGRAQIESLLTDLGPGARAIVFGSRGAGVPGHVFNAVVNQSGVVKFFDGQIGRAAAFSGYTSFELLITSP